MQAIRTKLSGPLIELSINPSITQNGLRFHFGSLAHDNDAASSFVHNVELPVSTSLSETTPFPILLDGSQNIAKYNRSYKDEVRILLALYRISAKNVDIVFSANIPIRNESGEGLDATQISGVKDVFLVAARSLRIVDLSLFAGDDTVASN